MSKYKKLQLTALAVELIALLIWGYHTVVASLPDWTLRLNGIVMLVAMAVLAFASVRVYKNL